VSESSILISVVIPTRHRNDLLRICLDQLAPGVQTIPADQYEVIVTDDGNESTAEALLKEHYPWVRWVAGPRKGPGANRNSGVEHARGEWIAFTDDDCIPKPDWLEGYIKTLTPNTFVYEGQTICNEEYCPFTHETPTNTTGKKLWACNLLINRQFFIEFGKYDIDFSFSNEDADFRERLQHQKILFLFVPIAMVEHPPRLKRLGVASGQTKEGIITIHYKSGNRGLSTLRLIKLILVTWHSTYKQWGHLSHEVFRSLWPLAQELVYVAIHAPRWSHKYYLKYKDQPPSYHFRVM